MNVNDAEKEAVTGDMLEAIFARQEELMSKYHKIESDNRLLQTSLVPVDLDDRF